jgi:hypothetical protein
MWSAVQTEKRKRKNEMNQALELIAEANAHRERAYIRDGDGNVIGDDPIHHAIADRAVEKLLNFEADEASAAEWDESVPYAVEPPLEFCAHFVGGERSRVRYTEEGLRRMLFGLPLGTPGVGGDARITAGTSASGNTSGAAAAVLGVSPNGADILLRATGGGGGPPDPAILVAMTVKEGAP